MNQECDPCEDRPPRKHEILLSNYDDLINRLETLTDVLRREISPILYQAPPNASTAKEGGSLTSPPQDDYDSELLGSLNNRNKNFSSRLNTLEQVLERIRL
jgi:hypothetical protein